MTKNQFAAALRAAKMPKRRFARLLGVAERNPRRWASGEVAVPPAIAIIARLLAKGTISEADLIDA